MAAKLAGAGGGRYDVNQNASINVTPFVDVMLVLLIIFMVAAPLATVTIKINLPPAQAKAAKSPPKPIYLSIKRDGRVYVGDDLSDLDGLSADLTKAIGGRDPQNERIFIRGDKDMEYGDFMAVVDKLQDGGFYSVALVGQDKSGLKHK
ncbi:MAG TPA: biopolymer transporter ExbD [Caulobacteraceae bacterium]|jgi:TonB system transport protein ExbD (group 1)|nr:biopolymer transporter ExbD [Caulobacteraceae bacterium]